MMTVTLEPIALAFRCAALLPLEVAELGTVGKRLIQPDEHVTRHIGIGVLVN